MKLITCKTIQLLFTLILITQAVLCAKPQNEVVLYPGLAGQDLINNLATDYKPAHVLGYDTARDTMYAVIDNHNDSVTCVYSGYTIYLNPAADPSTDAYNKDINAEHTWPQSMGADQGNARSDMHHLFPARMQVNSSRGNGPFDEIDDPETDRWWRNDYDQTSIPTSLIDEYAEKDGDADRFEPRESHKGNAARAVFYFYTMYHDQADSNFFAIQKEVLKTWHEQDPADEWEMERANRVALYQDGKVNPFILDSTLVRRAYFSDDPVSNIMNPGDFLAVGDGDNRIDLSWTQNPDQDDVLIVWNNNGIFSKPQDGVTYADGISGLGGMVIGRTPAISFAHANLIPGQVYYYRIYSVHGQPGSEEYSAGTTRSASTFSGYLAQAGDIMITEIMQNPSAVADSDGEWFEIYNRTSEVIDLAGWYVKDNDTNDFQISDAGPLFIQPESYLVFSRNANTLTNGGVNVDYAYSGMDLANSADELVLLLPDGTTEIDRVEYDGGPNWPDLTGASMYFTGTAAQNNNDPVLWAESDVVWDGSAGDRGTPGYSNAVSALSYNKNPQPSDLRLGNYPNPFNPQTTITYKLKEAGSVNLDIFNIMGQKILSLVSGFQHAGEHKVNWNGNDALNNLVSSGIYIVQIKTRSGFERRKMTLMR